MPGVTFTPNSPTSATIAWSTAHATVTGWIVQIGTNPLSRVTPYGHNTRECNNLAPGAICADTVTLPKQSNQYTTTALQPNAMYYVTVTAQSTEGAGCNHAGGTFGVSSCTPVPNPVTLSVGSKQTISSVDYSPDIQYTQYTTNGAVASVAQYPYIWSIVGNGEAWSNSVAGKFFGATGQKASVTLNGTPYSPAGSTLHGNLTVEPYYSEQVLDPHGRGDITTGITGFVVTTLAGLVSNETNPFQADITGTAQGSTGLATTVYVDGGPSNASNPSSPICISTTNI